MAIHKRQAFLASRFEEFHELRGVLRDKLNTVKTPPIEAVDLNDNAAGHHPPPDRCLNAVDNSELFVLLIGDTYGEPVPGYDESYTQLEYKRALSNKRTTILPFVIRSGLHSIPDSQPARSYRLEKWVAEIKRKHTLSYLDASLGSDHLARTIVQQVSDQMFLLFAEGDISALDEFGEQVNDVSEEPIIKRDLLANAPKRTADEKNLLKALANDHAKEALKALVLGLPHVGIHHLQKAVDMVPLDVVLGYWLARLLVGTGSQRHCEEGRRVAHRCAEIADVDIEEQKLEAMACLIIAARASERMAELQRAKQYARKAFDKVSNHWLAKLEYARQLALSRESGALKLVEDAFWLRPETIFKVHSDVAFRGLGQDFSDFRAKLRQTVEKETEHIDRLARSIREFAVSLSIPQPADIQQPIETESDHKQPIIQLVRNSNLTMKTSLHVLQRCALKLATTNEAFEFNSHRGLSAEVKVHIEEGIRADETQAATLRKQHSATARKGKQWETGRTATLVGGILVCVVLFAIAVIAMYAGGTLVALVTIIPIAVVGLATSALHRSIGLKLSTNQRAIEDYSARLQRAEYELAQLKVAEQHFNATESRLRKNLEAFSNLVEQYENKLKRIPFSPAPPIDRKGRKDLVRTNSAKIVSMGLGFDAELLPSNLRFFIPASAPRSEYWLARLVNDGATESFSRSAAYFHKPAVTDIYLYKDGVQSGPFTLSQLQAQLKAGQVQANDSAWFEGAPNWMPLLSIPGVRL